MDTVSTVATQDSVEDTEDTRTTEVATDIPATTEEDILITGTLVDYMEDTGIRFPFRQ